VIAGDQLWHRKGKLGSHLIKDGGEAGASGRWPQGRKIYRHGATLGARSPKSAILTRSGNGARSQEERKKTESLARAQVGHVRLPGKAAVDIRG